VCIRATRSGCCRDYPSPSTVTKYAVSQFAFTVSINPLNYYQYTKSKYNNTRNIIIRRGDEQHTFHTWSFPNRRNELARNVCTTRGPAYGCTRQKRPDCADIAELFDRRKRFRSKRSFHWHCGRRSYETYPTIGVTRSLVVDLLKDSQVRKTGVGHSTGS